MNKKPSNPKKAYGDTKVGVSSIPMGPLYEIALAMMEGGLKYGRHNYRDIGCQASTYFDAAVGHIVSWWEGEDFDPESGIHHLMKASACLVVMRDSQLMGNDTDDRPIKYPDGVPLRKNPRVQELLDKYPEQAEPFTQISKIKRQKTEELLEELDVDPQEGMRKLIEDKEDSWADDEDGLPDEKDCSSFQDKGPDGYRESCNGCRIQQKCKKESEEEAHCSDCIHYYLDFTKRRSCYKGKLLLSDNPPVGTCKYFERKAND